ncbi:hypothetical protein [Streptomyces sp. G45]|uniref:hypothetical protein n=1 Tax=Streptomyces sp. G45 TaxID=3406627 RepID=UPI003C1DB759
MTRDVPRTPEAPAVRLRVGDTVDEETAAYAREKVDAVVGRAGLPAVTGEVRVTHAAQHADGPWTARAELRVGTHEVVALARAATGKEAVDQLQDRLRRRTDKAAHAWLPARRAAAPPWRGGRSTEWRATTGAARRDGLADDTQRE